MPALAPDWQDWLAGNVVRGCSDADMLATMRQSGFDEHYARVAISVVRSMTERVQQQAPAMLATYRADPCRLPGTARFRAADRDVGIGFALVDPNISLIHDLISEQECEKLIALSAGKLTRSSVLDRQSGGDEISPVRTSEGTFFERGENALVARLEQRIAALTGLPVEHGEPLQILHYKPGNEYLAHHDYFDPADPGSTQSFLAAQTPEAQSTLAALLLDRPPSDPAAIARETLQNLRRQKLEARRAALTARLRQAGLAPDEVARLQTEVVDIMKEMGQVSGSH